LCGGWLGYMLSLEDDAKRNQGVRRGQEQRKREKGGEHVTRMHLTVAF